MGLSDFPILFLYLEKSESKLHFYFLLLKLSKENSTTVGHQVQVVEWNKELWGNKATIVRTNHYIFTGSLKQTLAGGSIWAPFQQNLSLTASHAGKTVRILSESSFKLLSKFVCWIPEDAIGYSVKGNTNHAFFFFAL